MALTIQFKTEQFRFYFIKNFKIPLFRCEGHGNHKICGVGHRPSPTEQIKLHSQSNKKLHYRQATSITSASSLTQSPIIDHFSIDN
jgi:hypothetical protein